MLNNCAPHSSVHLLRQRNQKKAKGGFSVKLSHLLACTALTAMLGTVAPVMAQERVPPVEIFTTTESYDPIRYEGAFIIADAWRELGLDVTVSPLEFRTLLDRFYSEQDFDTV